MFETTPPELSSLPQWINFVIRDGKKLPINSRTGQPAKSNDPETWSTFEEAVANVMDETYPYIGFCFDSEDPFFFIDLDEEHPEILAALPTYAQRSVSGEGIHIIGRGSFAGTGTHPKAPAVGIFQTTRFCLFTGDVLDNRNTINPVDGKTLQSIYNWVSGGKKRATTNLVEVEQTREDEEVFNRCKKRFDTFVNLYSGQHGKDHSESDHALISMLCDETESNEQVRRMFMASPLCRPHRADTTYINRSISKTRASQQRMREIFSSVSVDLEEEGEEKSEFQDLGSRDILDSMPEGLLKRMADWVWHQSKYPLQEAALSAAFGIMSTVAGRNYQTYDQSGLNLWFILVGDTGSGKNEYQNGISKIVKNVSEANTLGPSFFPLFNGEFASGQAVEDILAKKNRCFSYFPEFDEIYHQLASPHAAPPHKSLKKALLNIYMQSSKDGYLQRRMKARQKGDDPPDETPIQAPCLIIGGETTPEALYDRMTLREIATGFLQRFSILNVEPSSISRRTSPNRGIPMPDDLVDELLEFFTHCENLSIFNEFVTVKCANDKSKKILDEHDNLKRDRTLDKVDGEASEANNRAGIKAQRLAAQLAVSNDWRNPLIHESHAKWAIMLVDYCDNQLIDKFSSGSIGTGQVKQESEILKVIREALELSPKRKIACGIPKKFATARLMIPHSWLKQKMVGTAAFASDRNGAITAFERCLNSLIQNGILVRQAPADAEAKYGKGCGALIGLNRE